MKKIIYSLFIFFNICFGSLSREYQLSFEKLNDNNKKIIVKVNNYFNSINTLKSNFLQYSEVNGDMSEGIFYILKPEKIRFEYTYPSKTLLIMNKNIVTYYDIDLDEITTISKNSNPLFDFFSKQQNLEDLNSKIISIKKQQNKYYIETIIKIKNIDNAIKIVYIFNENIDNLIGFHFNDGDNGDIEIKFFKTELNTELKNNLFSFKNPRLQKKKK